MAESKTYLNVPYSQKDAAKALGARWDPSKKKWYIPAKRDITPFAQWHIQGNTTKSTAASTRSSTGTQSVSTNKTEAGIIIHATDKDFVAYCGDKPPWD